MNAPSQIKPPADRILTFLPGISEAEYEQRRRLRQALDYALVALARPASGIERQLWITLRDHAEEWVLTPAPIETIMAASEVCTYLWRSVQRVIALNNNIDLGAARDGGR